MTDEIISRKLDAEGVDLLTLSGVNDANLLELQRQTGARVSLRGETLSLSGTHEQVERAGNVAQRMIDSARQQLALTPDDVLRMALDGTGPSGDNDSGEYRFVLPGVRKVIQPKHR